jgi:phage shock protein A
MFSLLIYTLVVLAVVGGLVLLSLHLNGQSPLAWLKPMTDEQKLQKSIDDAAERLSRASAALQKSQAYVSQVQRKLNASQVDKDALTAQIKEAVAANDDAKAKKLIARLQREEAEFKALEEQLGTAIKDHEFYSEAVEEERRSVLAARQEADSLNIRLELAQADNAYRNSSNASEELAKMRAKVQGAEVHSKMGRGRDEEDEFLEAGKESSIEDRLREFKSGA